MKNLVLHKREKNGSGLELIPELLITQKKWKGGRLKKRLNAHASHIGQIMHSSKNVLDFLKASWLSPVIFSQRFPRGKKNELICLSLLIDNKLKN